MPAGGPPAVARVLEQVTKTARKHGMFGPGDRVLASVSGGPDSTCLLHALVRLRRLFGIELAVFHFDHRLRQGSARDADYVRRMARRLELPFHLRSAEDRPLKGESVEAWARKARRMAAFEAARDEGCTHIAEAHTRDDQAETILMGLIRGGGLPALAGIAPVERLGKPPIRDVEPLLQVTREEVEAFCRALRLRPRQDPTNRDTRLLRNAIRLRVIPEIERATRREVKKTMARTAEILRETWERVVRDALEVGRREELGRAKPGDSAEFHVGWLRRMSPPTARVQVRDVLRLAELPLSRETIDAVVDLARGRPGRRRDLPGGLLAVRERGYVRLSRPSPEKPATT